MEMTERKPGPAAQAAPASRSDGMWFLESTRFFVWKTGLLPEND
jgi:hypothetical protein